MAGYRIYLMTADHHIAAAAEFECDYDEEARLHAQDQRDARAMELWSGARIVEK